MLDRHFSNAEKSMGRTPTVFMPFSKKIGQSTFEHVSVGCNGTLQPRWSTSYRWMVFVTSFFGIYVFILNCFPLDQRSERKERTETVRIDQLLLVSKETTLLSVILTSLIPSCPGVTMLLILYGLFANACLGGTFS